MQVYNIPALSILKVTLTVPVRKSLEFKNLILVKKRRVKKFL